MIARLPLLFSGDTDKQIFYSSLLCLDGWAAILASGQVDWWVAGKSLSGLRNRKV